MVLDHSFISRLTVIRELLIDQRYLELVKIDGKYNLQSPSVLIEVDDLVRKLTYIDTERGVLSPLDVLALFDSINSIITLFHNQSLSGVVANLLFIPKKEGFEVLIYSEKRGRLEKFVDVNFITTTNSFIIWFLELTKKIPKKK